MLCLARWSGRGLAPIGVVVVLLLASVLSLAQEVRFSPLTATRECRVLLPLGDKIYGGLGDGGVVAWDAADPSRYTRLTVGEGLSGQRVTALVALGADLWVGTSDAGVTRVTMAAGGPTFRRYSNLGGLDVSALAGTMRGTGEVVYYGLVGAGVGVINSGLPGDVYTQEGHGLVANSVTALTFFRDDLWIGTEEGVSRFAANEFTTQIAGLTDVRVNTLYALGDTLLLAGTFNDGVFRWDESGAQWRRLGTLDGLILSLVMHDGAVWALREGAEAQNRLWRWDGGNWTAFDLPDPHARVVAQTGGSLWCAGTQIDPDMDHLGRAGRAFLARRGGDSSWTSWTTQELLFLGVDGVDFGPAGAAWLGSREGVGVARRSTAGAWAQVTRLATAANDSSGLIRFGANILSLVATPTGDVWFTEYFRQQSVGGGLVRVRPGAAADLSDADFLLLTTANSPLDNQHIVKIVRHPDGPLLLCSDQNGVTVLVDPDHPRNPASWASLPDADVGGNWVRDAVVTSRDVIWFAVAQVGLVRWDINGGAGPDAPLTWTDQTDDAWSTPLGGENLQFVRGLAVGLDGTLWAGGSKGLFGYRLLAGGGAELLASYRQKQDVFVNGLLTSDIYDVEVDDNGDVWLGLDIGLNRVRRQGDTTVIDAWTNPESYDALSLDLLYTPSIIAGLPSGPFYELANDPASGRLVAGSGFGATLIDVAPSGTQGDVLAGLYLYPNPFVGRTGASGLKLGGIVAETADQGAILTGGAAVEVYNLQGQLVHRNSHVTTGVTFWDGRNLVGDPVSSGLYLVRVTLDGQYSVRTLAVVR